MSRPIPGASGASRLAVLARIGRGPRIALVVVCLLLAAVTAVVPHRAAPAHTVPVVVAARALPAGHVLSAADLAVSRLPRGLPPDGARAAPSSFVGQRLAGPVSSREVLTGGRIVGRDLAAGLGPDTVATAVDVGSDLRSFVRAGDLVDLIAVPADGVDVPSGTGARTIGTRLLVLAAVPAPSAAGDGEASTQLVLATDRALAVRIAALHTSEMFAVVAGSP